MLEDKNTNWDRCCQRCHRLLYTFDVNVRGEGVGAAIKGSICFNKFKELNKLYVHVHCTVEPR